MIGWSYLAHHDYLRIHRHHHLEWKCALLRAPPCWINGNTQLTCLFSYSDKYSVELVLSLLRFTVGTTSHLRLASSKFPSIGVSGPSPLLPLNASCNASKWPGSHEVPINEVLRSAFSWRRCSHKSVQTKDNVGSCPPSWLAFVITLRSRLNSDSKLTTTDVRSIRLFAVSVEEGRTGCPGCLSRPKSRWAEQSVTGPQWVRWHSCRPPFVWVRLSGQRLGVRSVKSISYFGFLSG